MDFVSVGKNTLHYYIIILHSLNCRTEALHSTGNKRKTCKKHQTVEICG